MLAVILAGVVIGGGTTASFAGDLATSGAAAATPVVAAAPVVAPAPAVAAVAAARCCHITIPGNYQYNTSHPRRTLHDYCTHSPDEFPAPGTNANFRGPCARHDLCYDGHLKSKWGCDTQLRGHLGNECTYTYAWYDPRREACQETADIYFAAVVLWTLWP
jgi:hypothetical protein